MSMFHPSALFLLLTASLLLAGLPHACAQTNVNSIAYAPSPAAVNDTSLGWGGELGHAAADGSPVGWDVADGLGSVTSCDGQDGRGASAGRCGLLEKLGIDLSGFIWQSVNTNSTNPTNPPGGAGSQPAAGWMYRSDEYMLNRASLTLARLPDTSCSRWSVGGQIDLLYGTDYLFLQSRGLETEGDFSNRWNSDSGVGLGGVGLMGFALPQAYLQIANDVHSIKLGHFYHPLGFERFDVTGSMIGNTATYSLFFSEFLPVTGIMVDSKLTDQVTLTGGLHRGNGNWEDNNNRLNGFGALTWISPDQDALWMFVFDVGAEDDAGANDQYIHSLIYERKFCGEWRYIFHSDYGHVENGAPSGGDADWYSFVNTLGYVFSGGHTLGMRYERFNDNDGARVIPAPGAGLWNALAVGGTYKARPTLWFRPELRWDWFDADEGVAAGPFGDGTERSQFMASFSAFTFF